MLNKASELTASTMSDNKQMSALSKQLGNTHMEDDDSEDYE